MTHTVEDAATRNLRLLGEFHAEQLGGRAEILRRVKATYRRTARDEHFNTLLDQCIRSLLPQTRSGGRGEATGIVVLGESGAGKSRMVKADVGGNAFLRTVAASGNESAAVGVRCLGAYTLRVLAMEIIRATGYPVRNLRENVAWIEVRDRLRLLGVMVLCIDEVNNLVNTANRAELKRILNNFKALLNHPEWPVVLVLSGTPGCEGRLRQDKELCRRLNWMNLDPLEPSDLPALEQHLGDMCEKAELLIPDGLMAEVLPRLLHAGRAQFGSAIDLAVRALEVALMAEAGSLRIEHFATAYARRTQAHADANPFRATNWAGIVPMPIADEDDDAAWDMAAAEAARSRARVGLW